MKPKIRDIESVKIIIALTVLAIVSALVLGVLHTFMQVDETARFREKLEQSYASALTDREFDLSKYNNTEYTEIKNVYEAEDGALIIISKSNKAYSTEGLELIVIIKEGKIVSVLKNKASETPGLGSKALDENYLNRYVGFSTDDFHIPGDAPSFESGSSATDFKGVDNVTGATKSSNGVRLAVEAAVRVYLYLAGGKT